jgi:hypothetical protein
MKRSGDQGKSHNELLNEAIATPLKRCDWIGEQGGGEKSVKFWTEMMAQRPVAGPNVSNWQTQVTDYKPKNLSEWQTKITVNKDKYPKGLAGKGSGMGFDSYVRHPQSIPQFSQEAPEFHSSDKKSQSNPSQPQTPQKAARFAAQPTPSVSSSCSELITGKTHPNPGPGVPGGPFTKPNPYTHMSHTPHPPNPFKIPRPATSILYQKHLRPLPTPYPPPTPRRPHAPIIGLETHWTKFCRSQLGPKSTLTCLSCSYILCSQKDVKPHTFQWYKGRNQERNQTGFGEDDCDGGLAGTYSRVHERLNTEPKDCDKVFLGRAEWMRFYSVSGGGWIGCPGCGGRVGVVKLSG